MSFINSLNISASGMSAQKLRLDVAAENIANQETTRTENGGPYRRKMVVLQAAEERYRGLNLEFRQAETEGLTIAEALRYESGLRFLEDEIQREAKRLREYEAAAEEKRRQVVAARQDTASLEKLKDKKWEDYQKQVQKGEELLIEELVTAARARTAV